MMDDEDDIDTEGEMVEIDEEVSDVEDTEDGGAIVRLGDEEAPGDSEFYSNLAEEMPDSELSTLSTRFLDLISKDKEARKKRDEQYEEGIRRTGLGDDAPGGAQFQGASKVVHPMMTEACIDFASRAIRELLPPQGPVKDLIEGEITMKKLQKAKRKTRMMNWQLTVQSKTFRAELEQLLTQVPLGGAQYLKITWDEARNRPDFLFVAIDDMYLPFAATNFNSAQRKTHVQYLTQLDYEQRVKSGMYRDVELTPPSMEPERSIVDVANDKIEGRSDTSYNEDGLRTVFEIHAVADVEGDGSAPYILTVDKSSGKVLSIYRNWDEEDESREPLAWFVEWPFIPWRGAYPIGLPHMIGGLSAAATGALRALMDSAHIQNVPTMLKLKGGTRGGQSLNIQPTQVEEIEGGINIDDVRKIAMPIPFNPPSPTLFQLLGFVVDAGKGVVRTSMDNLADQNPNAPVGTTLALIQEGMTVFSAIHGRLHNAMAQTLDILHRLNGMHLDDDDTEREVGEELATRADFQGPKDVVPVSDPTIFSEAQRFAQVQAVSTRAAAVPQLYNARKVEERLLETLRVPNYKELLVPPLEPKQQNAVNENVTATMGKPVVAFPEQDHIAHLKTHLAYMTSPALGGSQLIAPQYLPVILQHLKEHVALWYASTVLDLAEETSGVDISEEMKLLKDHEARRAFDRMLAEASQSVVGDAANIFASLPPIIAQAMEMMQQFAPQPPQDPRTAIEGQKLQAQTQRDQAQMQMQTQRDQAQMQADAQKTQAQMQIEGQRMQLDGQKAQAQMQLEGQKMQAQAAKDQVEQQLQAQKLQIEQQLEQLRQGREDARKAAELNARMTMNQQDNQTAMQLAQAEIMSGERIAVSTGTGINPNP
jgi:chaperonin GroES